MFESRHVSRHFEKRCRQSERQAKRNARSLQANPPSRRLAEQKAARREANRRRRAVVKRLPKLSLAVHAASHLILAARASTGTGADHRHFVPLLSRARRRMRVEVALADAGYDSENNHFLSREVMGVRSLIPATIGRSGTAEPQGHYRRLMRRRLRKGTNKRDYGQRWQVETVNSMLKRNCGSACRARSPTGRKKDMLLRAVTHNLMILTNL